MAERLAVELGVGAGMPLRVEWAPAPASDAERQPGLRLEGEIDWDRTACVRAVHATLPGGRRLALAALRPRAAAGHGDEEIAAVLVAGGAAEPVAEALLSVESGADGLPRRLGVELDADPDALPLRVAADVAEAAREVDDGLERIWARLDVRLEGKRSQGLYEALRCG